MSKEKEASENLLETSLVYSDEKIKTTDQSFVKPVSIWLISYVLSVFMLFDWIIKESSKPITNRFTFLKVNYKRYLLYNLRSEEHTSELQSRGHLVCRLLLEKKK